MRRVIPLLLGALVLSLLPAAGPAGATATTGAEARQRVLVVLDRPVATSRLTGTGAGALRRMWSIGVVAADATPRQVDRLRRIAGVASVTPDAPVQPSLTDSVPYVGGTAAHVAGFTGAGQWIAVLDTGVDTTHPTFQGKSMVEACFSSGLCPNGDHQQTGPGSAAPGSCGGCAHGTHVAGIAVGIGDADLDLGEGMAPGAGLVAVQVFDRPATGKPAGTEETVLSGLDYVAGLASTLPIAAVNLSLTFSPPPSTGCAGTLPAIDKAVTTLEQRGVGVIAASGNDGSTAGVSFPACIPDVVSVGSIDLPASGQPERVSSFTNSGPNLDLLAPGSGIRSSMPGGGAATMSGTSMATPFVSGALALRRACRPKLPTAVGVNALRATAVVRSYTGRGTLRRLDAAALVRKMGDSVGVRAGDTLTETPCQNGSGPTTAVSLANPAATVLVGDWDGNGTDTLGYRVGNSVALSNRSDGQAPFTTFAYGVPADTPVVGDWDGNGTDTIGVRRGNSYYLRNSNTSGAANVTFGYGVPADTPVVGDWDGNGTDTPGVRRGNSYYLRNSNTSGVANLTFGYGTPSDTPVVGDWDDNGTDDPGVRRSAQFLFRLSNTSGPAALAFTFGSPSDVPLIGDWDG